MLDYITIFITIYNITNKRMYLVEGSNTIIIFLEHSFESFSHLSITCFSNFFSS